MKVALIGDIHANLPALEAVLAHAHARGVEAVWNVGDCVGYGAFPDEVVARVAAEHILSIGGSYDLKTLQWKEKRDKWPKGKVPEKWLGFRWTYENLSRDSRHYLRSLSREVRLEVDGRRVLLTHGSPASNEEPLGPETTTERLQELAAMANASLVVAGHSHRPFHRKVNGVWFVNPGSVGRMDNADPGACYAILHLRAHYFRVRYYRVAYDVDRAIAAIRERGVPDALGQAMAVRPGLGALEPPERSSEMLERPGADPLVPVEGPREKARVMRRAGGRAAGRRLRDEDGRAERADDTASTRRRRQQGGAAQPAPGEPPSDAGRKPGVGADAGRDGVKDAAGSPRAGEGVATAAPHVEQRLDDETADRHIQAALVLAQSCNYAAEHTHQVTRLALQLFDVLQPLHGLGQVERLWLQLAGLLHDIGWIEGRTGHHKTALRIVLSSPALLLDARERLMIGSVARYHRGALPSERHPHFTALEPVDQQTVRVLAALLRVADGLDCSHRSLVHSVTCEVAPDAIVLRGAVDAPAEDERLDALDKAALLEQTLNRKLLVAWTLP